MKNVWLNRGVVKAGAYVVALTCGMGFHGVQAGVENLAQAAELATALGRACAISANYARIHGSKHAALLAMATDTSRILNEILYLRNKHPNFASTEMAYTAGWLAADTYHLFDTIYNDFFKGVQKSDDSQTQEAINTRFEQIAFRLQMIILPTIETGIALYLACNNDASVEAHKMRVCAKSFESFSRLFAVFLGQERKSQKYQILRAALVVHALITLAELLRDFTPQQKVLPKAAAVEKVSEGKHGDKDKAKDVIDGGKLGNNVSAREALKVSASRAVIVDLKLPAKSFAVEQKQQDPVSAAVVDKVVVEEKDKHVVANENKEAVAAKKPENAVSGQEAVKAADVPVAVPAVVVVGQDNVALKPVAAVEQAPVAAESKKVDDAKAKDVGAGDKGEKAAAVVAAVPAVVAVGQDNAAPKSVAAVEQAPKVAEKVDVPKPAEPVVVAAETDDDLRPPLRAAAEQADLRIKALYCNHWA